MRPQRPVAVACLSAAAAGGARGQSTVSVYLPFYDESDWAALRGSVLSSDASVTAYTIFCADQAPGCQIEADLPFVFTEGAHTLVYTGAAPPTLTADLECELDGTTAATCTGSSSYGSGYQQGTLTGPAETVWTKTFDASEVTWGVLTLATPGPVPGTTDLDGTVMPTATTTPAPTSGAGRPSGKSWAMVMAASLGAALLGILGA